MRREPFKVLSLFAGIGGFDLGLERTGGFKTVAFCEIEPFPQSILRKHWPEVPIYDDVRTLTGDRLAADGIAVDVICGGFPCQDISVAGKRAGIADGTRSGLWSEVARLIGELRPAFVIVENVANLLAGPSEQPGGWFCRVLGDLAERGYDAEWENIPATAVGAWHRRERVWLVCYPSENSIVCKCGRAGCVEGSILASAKWIKEADELARSGADVPNAATFGLSESGPLGKPEHPAPGKDWQATQPFDGCLGRVWQSEPDVGRVAHGVPNALDRLAALGNAIVPQIAELIGRAILASEAAA